MCNTTESEIDRPENRNGSNGVCLNSRTGSRKVVKCTRSNSVPSKLNQLDFSRSPETGNRGARTDGVMYSAFLRGIVADTNGRARSVVSVELSGWKLIRGVSRLARSAHGTLAPRCVL